jgi:hypothetical protein
VGREIGVVPGAYVADLEVIGQNLKGLTMCVLDATMDELPRHYQRHIVGVFTSINRLLHRVVRGVTCYSEQHP